MRVDRIQTAADLARDATSFDSNGQYEEALVKYKLSLEQWRLAAKSQENQVLKEKVLLKMQQYVERAEQISNFLQSKKQRTENESNTNGTEKERLRTSLYDCISTEKPNILWSDVAGLEAAKECLQEAVILPTTHPSFFSKELRPWKGILLYGPPGTGKTHLARACATESSATFITVSSADLFSKWQGESEKLVRALFETARRHKPAIIFIDEVDSMCSARSSNDTDSSRRVKTEFLIQMQGLSDHEHSDGVLVLGTTNTPWEIDPGVRRRFERRIYIPLPSVGARRRLFLGHVGSAAHALSDSDLDLLAEKTEGYSGADISVLVRDSLYQGMRKCLLATHFKRVFRNGVEGWTPCSPADIDPSKIEIQLKELDADKLHPPLPALKDFLLSLENTAKTVGQEDMITHRKWAKEFGNAGEEISLI